MASPAFIAGDWGTSHLRLALCDRDGRMLAEAAGPGAAAVKGAFAESFIALTTGWRQQYGETPAILAGMVGSRLGWLEAPYVACPAAGKQIVAALQRVVEHDVVIVPGLSCRNRCGAPDVLRGEETQIFGALQAAPRLQRGRHLLCLPGTHTKWVVVEDGVVREFMSAPTGEIYSLLRLHSVLVNTAEICETVSAAFIEAAHHCIRQANVDSLHLLFECRSRQLLGDLPPSQASAYLSGLLIGRDVAGAMSLFGHFVLPDSPVILVGAAPLTALYAAVLRMCKMNSAVIDGNTASRLGCAYLFALTQENAHDRLG
jgi:2-dehydro-3-deoxygalactonokinase